MTPNIIDIETPASDNGQDGGMHESVQHKYTSITTQKKKTLVICGVALAALLALAVGLAFGLGTSKTKTTHLVSHPLFLQFEPFSQRGAVCAHHFRVDARSGKKTARYGCLTRLSH